LHFSPSTASYLGVTAETIAPSGAPPFDGLMPWLASLWKRLRDLVNAREATPEELQILHLMEFAGLRFGEPLVRVASMDDLDDRLDDLAGSPDWLHFNALLTQHLSLSLLSESLSSTAFAEAVGHTLGEAHGRAVAQSQQLLDAYFDAMRQVAKLVPLPDLATGSPLVAVPSLASPEIPAEVAELSCHGFKAGICSFAIAHVTAAGKAVEPWLARALIDRLVASTRQHLRLVASLPGVIVDEAIVPRSERLDLEAIMTRHERARAASRRSLEVARARLGT
jgi:hypothetical protein